MGISLAHFGAGGGGGLWAIGGADNQGLIGVERLAAGGAVCLGNGRNLIGFAVSGELELVVRACPVSLFFDLK